MPYYCCLPWELIQMKLSIIWPGVHPPGNLTHLKLCYRDVWHNCLLNEIMYLFFLESLPSMQSLMAIMPSLCIFLSRNANNMTFPFSFSYFIFIVYICVRVCVRARTNTCVRVQICMSVFPSQEGQWISWSWS